METNIFNNYRQWITEQKMPKGRRVVLLAGLDLFAQQGYNGTATAQIAEKAAVSQATIFKYFKTKQDLLLAIIQPILENLFPLYRDDFLPELDQFNTLPEIVHFIVQNRYQFIKDNAAAFTILLTELLTNPTIRTLFTQVVQASQPMIARHLLGALKKAGINDDLDPLAVTRTVIGQLLAYFIQQRLAPQIVIDESRDLQLIEMQILRAIQK
ncbi:TetR/AcrR family transcriptional regulator [Loigolactobacillus coryniformis]|jgi:AcrR family transcriptional regulator|uniref:TetR family transcriptional regulator n=1 Tax=Loigolactobacillus coryniformis subsp. torquens DSM 20004 = KCTC 3535 TaxID=1423822 RepID=A0A2D1KQX4_9LACO|nr:TetR/AcrR family transcriptional regulator [Loigolactobacillus coryniformis]ATO44536.1 TetR family transcriptional regulator [Loigolactobacillus coryniformis subsp. torquens DSM 20004 = KCTC 3535]KRK84992.1 TetR family transcriptional regulator [Loigolactobacillus coryniformis subsp. torquens DSM 20004 = KCTC 3535]MBW4803279.1 TetR/AcrR family transcriptional regulator [Loigolactobacillus coryniformis subsp. torquens]MBW4805975.1 TetR/AcrR family transcriptional regulator [Loigolactobacillus